MPETRKFILWDKKNKRKIEVEAKKAGKEWKAFCPFHDDKKTPNLSINDTKEGGIYYCFACGASGHLYEPGFENTKSPIEEIYNYQDKEGKLLFQVVKYIPKDFRQRRPDDKGGFIWNLKDVNRVIYNLPEIVKKPDKPIFIFEGEKDCNNSKEKFGILATTNSGGAGKWRTEYNQYFKNRNVILLPDNDEIGTKHMQEVGKSLKGITKSIKLLILPVLKEHGDISDWIEQGGNLEKLFELVKSCQEFIPPLRKKEKSKGYIREFSERFLTATDLINSDIPEEEMIIGNGLLPTVGFMVIGAYTKEGKTLLSLQLALNLISGTPFLGEFTIKNHNKVLYIFGENTESGLKGYLKRQIEGFEEKAGIKIGDRDLNNLVYLNGRNFSFSSKKNLDELREYLIKEEFNIVILDPIGRFIDFDINRGENILRFLKSLDTLGERAWILIHHYRKPDYLTDNKIDPIHKLVGSSNLGNYCESFIGLEREDTKKNENIKVLHFKMRREAEPAPVYLHRIPEYLYYEAIDFDDLPTVRETKIDDVVDILKNNFGGKATYKEFVPFTADRLGVTTQRIAQLLKDAKKAGIIDKDKKGKGAHWFIKSLF